MEKKKEINYINTPFNYTGNKFKLLEQLLPLFDYSKYYFIDIFAGGGSIWTNVVDKYSKILVNDIIEDLVNIQKLLLSDPETIIKLTKELCPSKDDAKSYGELRMSYNENKTPEKLWALMLSCTNNLMRFNQKGGFNQTFGKRGFNSNTQKKVDLFVNHISNFKDKIIFTSKDFHTINIKKPAMVYLDPPYGRIKNSDGKMSNNQISSAGYNNVWSKSHDEKLYKYIHTLDKNGSSFILSGMLEHDGNVSWMLDKLIQDGFKYKEIIMNYNKVSRKGNKNTKEIIIMNY
jgi:DNA adenine methylase Dam